MMPALHRPSPNRHRRSCSSSAVGFGPRGTPNPLGLRRKCPVALRHARPLAGHNDPTCPVTDGRPLAHLQKRPVGHRRNFHPNPGSYVGWGIVLLPGDWRRSCEPAHTETKSGPLGSRAPNLGPARDIHLKSLLECGFVGLAIGGGHAPDEIRDPRAECELRTI